MSGQRIGYIRVSTLDQNHERQLEGVELDRTFVDHASGKDTSRPELESLLRFVRAGDTLIVHSMDRLARNLDDLRHLVQNLTMGLARFDDNFSKFIIRPYGWRCRGSVLRILQDSCSQVNCEGVSCCTIPLCSQTPRIEVSPGWARIGYR